MAYRLQLVACADDNSETQGRIKVAIEEAGGRVETIESDRTARGTAELTYAVRLDDPRLAPGIAGAVERLRCVAVMSVTDPRAIRGLHRT